MRELELERSRQLARTEESSKALGRVSLRVEERMGEGVGTSKALQHELIFCFLCAASQEEFLFVALRKETTFSRTGHFVQKKSLIW